MAYQKVFEKPYPTGWKDSPDTSTPVLAEIMDDYDTAITHIENHLDGTTAIFPITATGGMSQPVGIDENGRLFTYSDSWTKLLDVREESSQTASSYTLADDITNYNTIAVSGYFVHSFGNITHVETLPIDMIEIDSSVHQICIDNSHICTVKFPTTTSVESLGQAGNTYIYQVYGQ